MHHTTWIIIIIGIWSLSACAAAPASVSQSDEPTPATHTSTVTPIPTNTVSAEQMTAAATFRPTLPASFTPTFTPTLTHTPTPTFTPSATFTPSPVPDDALCDALEISNTLPDDVVNVPLSDITKLWRVSIPYPSSIINVVVTNTETGEFVAEDTLLGGEVWTLDFRAPNFPDIADYTWTLTIDDNGRTGLCEQSNTFATTSADLITPEPTNEPAPETTALVIIVTATPETTPEATIITATPASDSTASNIPAVVEATSEPTATPIPLIFPPR